MNSIWIEFPATDLTRAVAFYESVFGQRATEVEIGSDRSIFVLDGSPTVSLNQTEGFVATSDGSLPYFHVDDLDAAIAASIAHGGSILHPTEERPGHGIFTGVVDSEGNGLYLHGAAPELP